MVLRTQRKIISFDDLAKYLGLKGEVYHVETTLSHHLVVETAYETEDYVFCDINSWAREQDIWFDEVDKEIDSIINEV